MSSLVSQRELLADPVFPTNSRARHQPRDRDRIVRSRRKSDGRPAIETSNSTPPGNSKMLCLFISVGYIYTP
jgi:hypothetical protein